MRNNMLIYRSFFEAIQEMPEQSQARIWNAIFELGLNNKEIKLEGLEKTIFTLIKPQIEANIKRYENGKTAKVKQNVSEKEAKQKQNESKTETNKNNNNNKNNNLSIEERKRNFYASLISFDYPKQMIEDFFGYWSEHGANDKKMRFEKEKSYDIQRRLRTWYNRNPKQYENVKNDDLLNFVKNQINGK